MIEEVKGGCPICCGDIKGTPEMKYYCEHCNILYDEPGKPSPKEQQPEKLDIPPPEEGKVYKTDLVREKGWLYFIDKKGDISRVKMARSRDDKGPRLHHKVLHLGIEKEKGYLYYLDKDLDVYRSPMKRGKTYKDKKEKIYDN